MFQWLYYWLDRLFAVMGAFLMCQFPQFYEQYLQRAMGHRAGRHPLCAGENAFS